MYIFIYHISYNILIWFLKRICICLRKKQGFTGGASGKEAACQCRRPGFDPWVRRSPGKGNANPLQYSCLENPIDRGVWQDTVHGVANSQKQLSIQEKNKRVENYAVI